MTIERHRDTLESLGQLIGGMGLASMPVWVQQLETWLQFFVVACGALFSAVGLWKLLFGRNNARGE